MSELRAQINAEIENLEGWMIEHLNDVCQQSKLTQQISSFENYDIAGDDLIGVAIADDGSKLHFEIKPDKTELSIEVAAEDAAQS